MPRSRLTMYERVVEQSSPLIEAYHDDLLIQDKEFFARNPEIEFLHFTGETGTNIFGMFGPREYPAAFEHVRYLFGRADRWHILEGELIQIGLMETHSRGLLVLHGNDRYNMLNVVTHEHAQLVYTNHAERLRSKWRAEEQDRNIAS